jgi:hypothetical protein
VRSRAGEPELSQPPAIKRAHDNGGDLGEAINRVVKLWDEVLTNFLEGRATNAGDPLSRWFKGYAGRGVGQVDTSCFPEPYLGDIQGRPRAAVLALNPGRSSPEFQSRDGIFATEIRTNGSYREWAKSWPYLREPWGYNRHHHSRMQFLKRWFRDDTFASDQRIDFELHPWHSTRVTARMRPGADIVRDYIWGPLSELPIEFIFAFGGPWIEVLPQLPGVNIVDWIGDGGRPYPTTSKPRAKRSVIKATTPTGAWFIFEKHGGGATPPSQAEMEIIKREFGFD